MTELLILLVFFAGTLAALAIGLTQGNTKHRH